MTLFAATFWIGGAPDSGKSTVARVLASRHALAVYHYDSSDAAHHERLSAQDLNYAQFMSATLDERWVDPDPAALFERALESFHDRWPLVIEDVAAMDAPAVLVEGFGLLPELVATLDGPRPPCVFLVPSDSFKAASFARRGKPSFGSRTRDPERVRQNMLERDRLLAAYVAESAEALGLPLIRAESGSTVEALAAVVESALGLADDPMA